MHWFVYALILALIVGCSAADPTATHGPSSIEKWESECRDGKGQWSRTLLSCQCPSKQIFAPGSGCTPLRLSARAAQCAGRFSQVSRPELEGCLASLYDDPRFSLQINLDGLPGDSIQKLATALDSDWSSPIRGLARPPSITKPKSWFQLSSLNPATYDDAFVTEKPFATLTSIEVLWGAEHRALDVEPCRALLPVESRGLCEELDKAMKLYLQPNAKKPQFAFLSFGESCLPNCDWTSNQVIRSYPSQLYINYQVFVRNQVPIRRVLKVEGYDASLSAYLNSTGAVDLIELKGLSFGPDGLRTTNQIFNGSWDLIRSSTTEGPTRHQIREALEKSFAPPEPFFFENPHQAVNGRAIALLLDGEINAATAGFRSRLAFDDGARDYFLAHPATDWLDAFRIPWLGVKRTPIEHAMDVSGNDDAHANHVASLLMKDLPEARIHLIRSNELEVEDTALRDQWIDYIRKNQVRVVNISQNFHFTDCDAFLGPLFQRLPEVLFVIGAGNTGTHNPDTCPAMLGSLYPNALTVAGSRGTSLHQLSSYGARVAQVAAPFEVPCQIGDAKSCSGTSFSAPLVANAVLKIMARHPEISVKAVREKVETAAARNPYPELKGILDWTALEALGQE